MIKKLKPTHTVKVWKASAFIIYQACNPDACFIRAEWMQFEQI